MKLPAILLYDGDWIKDNVSGCSLAAQGLWLRMMFIGHNSERYGYLCQNGVAIPPESIARRCGCTPEQYTALLAELDAAGVPSRTPDGTIFSRRMVRDAKEREATKKRVQKHRSNASVTPVKHNSSSSTSSSDPPPSPPPGEPVDLDLTATDTGQALCVLMGLSGFQLRQLAKEACESVRRRKPEVRMTEVPSYIQALWREYDTQPIHAKVSLKTFLGEIGRFMDSDSWKAKEKDGIGRGFVPFAKVKGAS